MRRGVALLVTTALAVTACARGADGSSAVEAALRHTLTSRSADTACEGLSAGLVARIYGDGERCRRIEAASLKARGPKARTVTVAAVRVRGDRASAVVRTRGGRQSGAHGTVTLRRQDGRWRIDDFSAAFLRSQFSARVRTFAGLGAPARRCLGQAVLGLADGDFRVLAYGSMGERADAQQVLLSLLQRCGDGTG